MGGLEIMSYNILVTGSNRGLGLALADKLLQAGHWVLGINRRHSDGLLRLQGRFPDRLHLFIGDAADESDVQKGLAYAAGLTDHLDVIVNNAAIQPEPKNVLIDEADFSHYLPSLHVNAVGPLMVVKHGLPLLRRGRKKLIVNISSAWGSIGTVEIKSSYAYCMSKAALNMACQLLQNGLEAEGIKVLAVHPGWFSSDMGGKEAPITPAEAAEKVADLLTKSFEVTGPIFMTSGGEEMVW